MRFAAFNTGDFRLLDHMAPFASLLEMPLFVESESNFLQCRKYYPQVHVEWVPNPSEQLDRFAREFDVLFESKTWGRVLKRVFWDAYQKDMILISCAHGQSDKGYASSSLHHYGEEDGAVIYGDLLHTMFRELKISARPIFTGNYRIFFYFKNKSFYDAIAEKEVFSSLRPKAFTALYAPTWNDWDEATTFFTALPKLLQSIPGEWNLIIKGHPLLEQNHPERYYSIAALAEKRPNTVILSEFPLIYPILSKVDLYLGDYSSVGYDMLAFEKPMFFFLQPHLPKGRLHACGICLEDLQDLPKALERKEDFTKEQRALYRWAFAVPSSLEMAPQDLQMERLHALQYPSVTANSVRDQIQRILSI